VAGGLDTAVRGYVHRGGRVSFWSRDSRFIGFFAQGKLKKVAASGGPSLALCDASDGPAEESTGIVSVPQLAIDEPENGQLDYLCIAQASGGTGRQTIAR
jgi:hypothetical protein